MFDKHCKKKHIVIEYYDAIELRMGIFAHFYILNK